ncbi:molybdopterin-dependent oxidoreductase [Vibrio sonorensis]|uniref:molybdopterin-dependent oxidoreductase n=1 Tax=Vibrio sonorensis TaxID=1004316 RepID=UPI0015861969|nr:molybdopterin-dependent oxidoreductase [Vibrio sonorensis]
MKWMINACLLLLSCSAFASSLTIDYANNKTTLTYEQITTLFEPIEFSTHLPWYETEKSFKGFRVSDLLEHLGVDRADELIFIALNDYTSPVKYDDLMEYQAVIAYEMDGERMKVRNKGPYWLIFNLNDNPEIDLGRYHA